MKKMISLFTALVVLSAGAFAVDLSVDAAFDVSGKVPAKDFLTVKGPTGSVEKDTVDATTGASKAKATEVWNGYRAGADKLAALPLGPQSLVKYGVSPLKQFLSDNLTVAKAADGVITVQYIHRGTAYKIVTDKTGKLSLPTGDYKKRLVAVLQGDDNLVSKDFSATGKVADVNWAKIWDPSVPDGTVIFKGKAADGKEVEAKTGKIADDLATSTTPYMGALQLTFVGNVLTVKGDLTLKK